MLWVKCTRPKLKERKRVLSKSLHVVGRHNDGGADVEQTIFLSDFWDSTVERVHFQVGVHIIDI